MKILTWNINGIRAVSEPLNVVLNKLNADIICLQETKITSKAFRNSNDSLISINFRMPA